MHVSYYVASSTDGFLAPSDGSLDWLAPFSGTGEDHGYTDFYASVDALVVGARTYEQMLGLGGWPHHDRPVTVMSSRSLPIAGSSITVSAQSPEGVLDSLASAGHQRVWLVGGGNLAGSFASADLIDEYIISYVPVVLGSGIGLFGAAGTQRALRFLDARSFEDGIVQCHYQRHER